jgi:hypothetical protein
LSNRRFSKKLIFTYCSVLIDFCHYLHLPLDLFLFWVLLITELLREDATVANVLIGVVIELKLNQKWIYYLAYTNVANKNCVNFCMKEVFKCRERRMMRWDEVWTKAQAWEFPCHPKKYPRSTSVKAWGCPKAPPSSSTKVSGHLSRYYIFISSYAMCFSWSVFIFAFSFILFCLL